MEKQELVSEKSIVTLQVDLKGIELGVQEFNKVKKSLIGTVHTMQIKGHPYIKKSGWRIVALGFNISDRIVSKEVKDLKDGEYVVTYTVETSAPNGRTVQAVGSCSTLEKTKSNERKYHDTETQAHTRAKNRAIADLVGLGEVTAEEMVTNGTEGDGSEVEYCQDVSGTHVHDTKNGICSTMNLPLRSK